MERFGVGVGRDELGNSAWVLCQLEKSTRIERILMRP